MLRITILNWKQNKLWLNYLWNVYKVIFASFAEDIISVLTYFNMSIAENSHAI